RARRAALRGRKRMARGYVAVEAGQLPRAVNDVQVVHLTAPATVGTGARYCRRSCRPTCSHSSRRELCRSSTRGCTVVERATATGNRRAVSPGWLDSVVAPEAAGTVVPLARRRSH